MSRATQSDSRPRRGQTHILHESAERDSDTAVATPGTCRAAALVIAPDAIFINRSEQLAALTLRHAVPAITQFREFAVAGGLMSYGPPGDDSLRLVAPYVDKILRGERASDLPIQQPTRLKLVINRKTAAALGLKIPRVLLLQADRVIE